MKRRPDLSALALGLACAAGCATIGRTNAGSVPPVSAVADVRQGATVGEVLERLGAPLESWLAPDGLLLVWREQQYDFERLELDPTRALPLSSLDPTIGALLANVKVIFERGTAGEDRVAVLFDRAGRVQAVAHRDRSGHRAR